MKAMGYSKVDITDDEFQYYKSLVKRYGGEHYFSDLFKSDDEGYITLITPKNAVPWEILFFIQNVMINQRLRVIDSFRKKEKK